MKIPLKETVSGIILIGVGWFVNYAFPLNSYPNVSFLIKSRAFVYDESSARNVDVKFSIKGHEAKGKVELIQCALTNSGNKDITPSDYIGPFVIDFGCEVIDAKIIDSTGSISSLEKNSSGLYVVRNVLINHDSAAQIEVFALNPPANLNPAVKSGVAGVSNVKCADISQLNYDVEKRKLINQILKIVILLFMILILANVFIYFHFRNKLKAARVALKEVKDLNATAKALCSKLLKVGDHSRRNIENFIKCVSALTEFNKNSQEVILLSIDVMNGKGSKEEVMERSNSINKRRDELTAETEKIIFDSMALMEESRAIEVVDTDA